MMPSSEDSNISKSRQRSNHACLTCRRKKTKCPGQRPACSSCVRLGQLCSYPAERRPSQTGGRSDARLANLEEKIDLIFNWNLSKNDGRPQGQASFEEAIAVDDPGSRPPPVSRAGPTIPVPRAAPGPIPLPRPGTAPGLHADPLRVNRSPSTTTPVSEQGDPLLNDSLFDNRRPSPLPPATAVNSSQINVHIQNLQPTLADIAASIALYFKFCHRQPIWCFERKDVSNYTAIPEELAWSIIALTARFSERRDRGALYAKNVKKLIMLRIADGTVDLATIEGLCLLSYSSFIDGSIQLGQFDLGLALQLCRSAMLDLTHVYASEDPTTERKKRLFWSLQILEQSYGRQTGLLSVPTEIWRPSTEKSSGGDPMEIDPNAPPLPTDELGVTMPSNETGVWNTSVNLGWVWSQVRKYVSDCSHNIMKEPWRHDSMYAKVLSDFMETENRVPICHRYDSVKFYERKVDDLRVNRDYWAPWLKEQFTYHAIHTVLNHPFLYIIGAQHNPNLAIPNTFWRRSSELALLHSTWIVRMIDMVVDKQMPLTDPFFGHIASIAATVHLYYCCAASARLRHKSNRDFAKCRRFLKGFLPISAACAALDRNLDRMTRIAAGPESVDVEDWMPSKIYLSVPLMWKILQFSFTPDCPGIVNSRLLDPSLSPAVSAPEDTSESALLEIIVATSPEININTANGGQEAPTFRVPPQKSSHRPMGSTSRSANSAERDMGSNANPSAGSSSNNNHNNGNRQAPSFYDEISVEQTDDSLTLNTTPWLYADSSQFMNLGTGFVYPNMSGGGAGPGGGGSGGDGGGQQDVNMGDGGGTAWWEADNFGNMMFSHF